MPDNLRVLFCADPLAPARVDEHFANQAIIVRELGGQVAVIDHDALLGGDVDAAVRRVPRDSGPWWYRGWMIPTVSYVELATAMERRGATLRVPPRQYRSAHELPGWYSTFHQVTPDSDWMAWIPGEVPTEQDVMALTGTLGPGPAVVKDFVKSRKNEWQEACYIPEAADLTVATAIVARMVELQEASLNGGIVLRRFENYLQRDGCTVEARVWWVDGAPVMITAHPDTPDVLVEPDLWRSKYAPLAAHLHNSGKATLTMTEQNFAKLVDGGLPPVAWRRREWWANEESPDSRHVQCHNGWRAGGYEVSTVDLAARIITFLPVSHNQPRLTERCLNGNKICASLRSR